MVAAGNGPSIANQRLLQYVTWKGKKWNEMDQLPRTEMQTNNLKWSVRGKINADAKKGNVEKKFKIHCFRGKHRRIHPRKSGESGKLKKRGSTQIQTGSKACSTTGNFAAKVVLLASVESCRNQFRRLFWIWSAKRERAWTNELFSRIWAISNASRSTELLHSKKWFNLVNNRNSSRAAKFKGQSKILCHSESR